MPIGSFLSGLVGGRNRYNVDPNQFRFRDTAGDIEQAQVGQQQVRGQQGDLTTMLQEQAAGQGPSAAQTMLAQETGQNVARAAGSVAGTRGINPALAARLALDAGAGINQTAIGQGATLRANEMLAGRGLLAQHLAGVRGQDLGAYTAGTQSALGQGQQVLGANQINAQISEQNAAREAALAGGLLSGISGAAAGPGLSALGSMFRGGGGYAGDAATGGDFYMQHAGGRYAEGGEVERRPPPTLKFDEWRPSEMPLPETGPLGYEGETAAAERAKPKMKIRPKTKADEQRMEPVKKAGGGAISMYDYLGITKPQGMAYGGTFMADGGVPGEAEVAGDSEENDTVPALLSPGEIVIPRSVAMSPNAPEEAAKFVAHLMKRGGSANMAEGGEVSGEPSEGDRFAASLKAWWKSMASDDAEPETEDAKKKRIDAEAAKAAERRKPVEKAIESARTTKTGGDGPVTTYRKKQDAAYEAAKGD